jgi:hypothetical protein
MRRKRRLTMTEREKVKEVLERLLESLGRPDRNRGGWKGTNFWADKLLALVGEGEPVAWRVERINETGGYLLLTHPPPLLGHYRALGKRTDPLYLRPPAGEREREVLMELLEFVDPNEVLDYAPVVKARRILGEQDDE